MFIQIFTRKKYSIDDVVKAAQKLNNGSRIRLPMAERVSPDDMKKLYGALKGKKHPGYIIILSQDRRTVTVRRGRLPQEIPGTREYNLLHHGRYG